MSVDTRLREAFRGETWDVEIRAALHLVHERAHRARVWKTAALAGVVAVIGAVGAAAGQARDQGMHEPVGSRERCHVESRRSPERSQCASTGLGRSVRSRQADPRHLREAGQGKWYRTVISDQPKLPLSYRMTIRNGRIDMVVTGADGERVPADQEYVSLSGRHGSSSRSGASGSTDTAGRSSAAGCGSRSCRPRRARRTSPPTARFQRALYTVADWTRAGAAR